VKSRRRGRRGGRKHRRGDGQPNGGQMPQQGTPAQAAGHAPDEGLFRAEPAAQVPPVQVQRIEPAVAPQVPPSEASPAPAWKLTAERTPVEKPPVAAAPAAAPAAEVAPAAKKSRKPRRPAAKKKPSAKKKSSLPDPNAIPEDTLGDDSFTDDV
jgi:ribonuclease E